MFTSFARTLRRISGVSVLVLAPFAHGQAAADTSVALATGSVREMLQWLDQHGSETGSE